MEHSSLSSSLFKLCMTRGYTCCFPTLQNNKTTRVLSPLARHANISAHTLQPRCLTFVVSADNLHPIAVDNPTQTTIRIVRTAHAPHFKSAAHLTSAYPFHPASYLFTNTYPVRVPIAEYMPTGHILSGPRSSRLVRASFRLQGPTAYDRRTAI